MQTEQTSHRITLFLCGDVMTGRGIDQILPHPGKPHLFEPYMRSALGYVELAEAVQRAASGGRWTFPTSGAMPWRSFRAPASGRAHHQSGNRRHHERGRLAEERHPLPHASRQHSLPYCRRDRLLRARQQPRARLGLARAAGDSGCAAGPASRLPAPAATTPRPPRRRSWRCPARAGCSYSPSASEDSGVPREWAAASGPARREFPGRSIGAA